MKIIAFIINIFLPGVGTLLVGKIGTGIVQIAVTMVGWLIGGPLYFIVWLWALISVATAQVPPPEPGRTV